MTPEMEALLEAKILFNSVLVIILRPLAGAIAVAAPSRTGRTGTVQQSRAQIGTSTTSTTGGLRERIIIIAVLAEEEEVLLRGTTTTTAAFTTTRNRLRATIFASTIATMTHAIATLGIITWVVIIICDVARNK
mmetsp:Transcript_26949/g.67889  ORF Transcript_26949/g.67889 Transcript_26949/m.67889 type:complete len:134 (+) Transcript_26949:389-790(+)